MVLYMCMHEGQVGVGSDGKVHRHWGVVLYVVR